MVLGHECAGIVKQVGSQVKFLMIGDRVALEPGNNCRQCQLCSDGRYNLHREMKFFGSPPTNGALAKQVGPDTKLIIAAGSIGLVSMRAARAFGSPKIVIVDIDDYHLSLVKDLGADEIIKVSSIMQVLVFPPSSSVVIRVIRWYVMKWVGFNKTMKMALQATRAGGKVCLVGLGQSEMTLPLTSAAASYIHSLLRSML
ncbi:hypothetical protein HAX54_029090 [Datura stramonium]|uniref:Alcohol dehydrogenase N-terminal domain-containing protein n=1 Tax=Datura stramonium TaxID=4076 RepID=A0ABS8RMB8_DATST|nr:hypothetical protein [Datura stramonium]